MSRDRETKARLLESARQEFIEKGYMKASLRNICKNAGVTTGALYFFFDSKEDLFEEIVEEAIQGISQRMKEHFEGEKEMLENKEQFHPSQEEYAEHLEMSEQIIHQLYRYRDEFLLVLTKSQGSKYENIKDDFIALSEKQSRLMRNGMACQNPEIQISDAFIHWLAHEQVEMYIHTLSHIEKEEDAIAFIREGVAYTMAGWYKLFGLQS